MVSNWAHINPNYERKSMANLSFSVDEHDGLSIYESGVLRSVPTCSTSFSPTWKKFNKKLHLALFHATFPTYLKARALFYWGRKGPSIHLNRCLIMLSCNRLMNWMWTYTRKDQNGNTVNHPSCDNNYIWKRKEKANFKTSGSPFQVYIHLWQTKIIPSFLFCYMFEWH